MGDILVPVPNRKGYGGGRSPASQHVLALVSGLPSRKRYSRLILMLQGLFRRQHRGWQCFDVRWLPRVS
jgi:hypothetical protein